MPDDLFPNIEADLKSKGGFAHERATDGTDKDEWLTPPNIIADLGPFDLDPCSPVNRPWPTAVNHFTERDNGLIKRWTGRVWCNPPYDNAKAWLARCSDHKNAIALVFARTDTEAWQEYVFPFARGLYFITGRVTFLHVSGEPAEHGAGAPSVLIAYDEANANALSRFSAVPGTYFHVNPPARRFTGLLL